MKKSFNIKIVANDESPDMTLQSVEANLSLLEEGQVINEAQARSMRGCCMYSATLSHTTPQMIEEIFCLCFSIENVEDLLEANYEDAIEWFIDFDMRKFVN